MNISQLSVKRPVTTLMVFCGILILGIISWSMLAQELFPSISFPQITVVTSYENAAPEEMENLVTKIVEEAVGTVNKVKRIKSFSKEGQSLVIIDFDWGTQMDFAALEIREKIDLVKERLPRECEEPIVMKYNPFDLPIMTLAITGGIPSVELREITKKYIKEVIEKIDGVANAVIAGGDIREIVVEIDQARLHASQVSIVSITDSLKNANLNYPAGTIKERDFEYLIRTIGEFQSIEEIENTPIALDLPETPEEKMKDEKEKKDKRLIYLRDIALVKSSIKEVTSLSRYNRKSSISLVIRKQSGVNTLATAREIRKEIKKLLEEKLSKEINIKIAYDQSTFIKESIANLRNAGIQGGILAFLVLFFFLKDTRSSLTITLSIPISLMATFCLMYFTKINLNMMSLGGLALGIGMLVDNSIVVIENIFRHRQAGKGLKKACGEGANEVFAPILGSTLTTIAVFFPFIFVKGLAGQIFKQLSYTVMFSLFISILVAVSLIPVIISMGRERGKRKELIKESPQASKKFSLLLSSFLKIKGLTIFIVMVLFFISLKTFYSHEKRFLPELDQRQFIIKLEHRPGTRLKITDKSVKKIENILFSLPEIKDVTVNIGSSEEKSGEEIAKLKTLGSHQAQIMINLKKLSRKIKRPTKKVIAFLKKTIEKDRQLRNIQITYLAQETSLGQAIEEASPIVIEVRGPGLSKLAEISSRIKEEMKKIKGLYSVNTSLVAPTPETKLNILKERASLYGLSVQDIALTSQIALKGYVATKFKIKDEGKDIDIRVRLQPRDRANLKNLRRLLIRSPLGMMIPLSEVAELVKGTGPTEIQRISQQKTILVTANILDRSLKEILVDVHRTTEKIRKKFSKIEDLTIEISGEQQKMQESYKSLASVLILAIIAVYMIMASEFESLWQPFIIMFTVPLSLIGATFVLVLTKTPLSAVAYLGIIMLGGIVVNNGIVLVDFINSLRKQGCTIREAAVKGASIRLRPILMTSFTTILGMLPLSLGIGAGSELRTPLARTVIGGLLSSTFLTLIVIPVIYVGFTEFMENLSGILLSLKRKIKKLFPQEPTVSGKIEQSLKECPPKEKTEKYIRKDFSQEITAPQELKQPFKEKKELTKPEEAAKEEIEKEVEMEKLRREILPQGTLSCEPTAQGKPQKPHPIKEKEKITLSEKGKEELNPRQKQLIEKLKTLKKISRADYAKMFNISTPTAARDLKSLVKKRLIAGKGPLGPGRWYELRNTDEK